MCGIAGVILSWRQKLNNNLPETIKRMTDALYHRGPDDFGYYIFCPENISESELQHLRVDQLKIGNCYGAFGHRRLSIIDLSDNARQPMQSDDGSLEITYNGEIYNYLELKENLAKKYTFRTTSDTEVLLICYKEWGEKMLSRLDGMFALAILDKSNNKLFLARDVAGIKPLYYGESSEGFWFSSEPRSIAAGRNVNLSFDRQRLSDFLLLGLSDHDNGSFFNGINSLEEENIFRII